ncbi:MAG TPA: hypothetical protein VM266_06020, partial [Solirubrobacteraceae bacterium]|nr:hypothetical protein [Solirubrobacteraceae bacterium]
MAPPATDLAEVVAAAGGAGAPASATAQLRARLVEDLRRGRAELARARSGYDGAVHVAVAARGDGLVAALPVDADLRADPQVAPERAWSVVAAAVGALVEAAAGGDGADLTLRAGALDGFLALHLPTPAAADDAELAALAFDERVAGV